MNSVEAIGRTRRESGPCQRISSTGLLPTAFPYCVSGAAATTPGHPNSLPISLSPRSPLPAPTHTLGLRAGVGARFLPGGPSQPKSAGPERRVSQKRRGVPRGGHVKARVMPEATPAQGGHCPQRRGCLRLRDTQSPRDAVTRPAPTTRSLLGAHVSTRRAPPASPASGRRWPGPSGGRLEGLPAPAAAQNPDSADAVPQRPRLGQGEGRPGAVSTPISSSAALPPARSRSNTLTLGKRRSSKLRHGPDSESSGGPIRGLCPRAAAARPRALANSGPCPTRVTHPRNADKLLTFVRLFAAAAAPNGVGADSRVSSCHQHHPRPAALRPPNPSLPSAPRPATAPTSPPSPEQRGPAASPGATATSRMCSCSQRIWRLDRNTVPLPLDRITRSLLAPPRPSLPLGGAGASRPEETHPSRGPTGRFALWRPRPGRFQPGAGAVPPRGPLPRTRRRLPAEVPAALLITAEDPGAPVSSWTSSLSQRPQ